MSRKDGLAAKTIDLCDRAEVFSEVTHLPSGVLDKKQFASLLQEYYPSLENFFLDIKTEEHVEALTAFIGADQVIFTAHFDDKTTKTFTYNAVDETI